MIISSKTACIFSVSRINNRRSKQHNISFYVFFYLFIVLVAQKHVYNFGTMATPLDKIADVDISANGIFKYILVNVHDEVNKQSKPIVRGYRKCTWHGKCKKDNFMLS